MKGYILSFGGGIQSTAFSLMFMNDDLPDWPKPDALIFADTGWERESTYQHVKSFSKLWTKTTGIPFITVSGGNLLDVLLNEENPRTEMPSFINASRWETIDGLRELWLSDAKKEYKKLEKAVKKQDTLLPLPPREVVLETALKKFEQGVASGEIVEGWKEMDNAMLGRQCTQRLKIRPIRKWIRENMKPDKDNPVGQYIGISLDEWHRMSSDEDERFELIYPLVKEGISREDCEQYILDSGFPLPEKSACVGCPYHSNATWASLNDKELEQVIHVEQILNHFIKNSKLAKRPYFANGTRFHPSMRPMWERPFETEQEVSEFERDGVCGAAGCML